MTVNFFKVKTWKNFSRTFAQTISFRTISFTRIKREVKRERGAALSFHCLVFYGNVGPRGVSCPTYLNCFAPCPWSSLSPLDLKLDPPSSSSTSWSSSLFTWTELLSICLFSLLSLFPFLIFRLLTFLAPLFQNFRKFRRTRSSYFRSSLDKFITKLAAHFTGMIERDLYLLSQSQGDQPRKKRGRKITEKRWRSKREREKDHPPPTSLFISLSLSSFSLPTISSKIL